MRNMLAQKILNPELKLDKIAKLRNDNFDQWDVGKIQIKSDDLINRVEINQNILDWCNLQNDSVFLTQKTKKEKQ